MARTKTIPLRVDDELDASLDQAVSKIGSGISKPAVMRKAMDLGLPLLLRAIAAAEAEAKGQPIQKAA